jgi:hypothetical protein
VIETVISEVHLPTESNIKEIIYVDEIVEVKRGNMT